MIVDVGFNAATPPSGIVWEDCRSHVLQIISWNPCSALSWSQRCLSPLAWAVYLFKSEEAGIYTMDNKTGKNCVPTSVGPAVRGSSSWWSSGGAGGQGRSPGEKDLSTQQAGVGTQSGALWFQTALALGIPAEGLSLTFAEGSVSLPCHAQPRLGGPKPLLEQPSMPRATSPLFLTKNPAHVSNWISEKCKLLLQCLPSSYGAGGVLPFLSCWNRYIP